MIKKNDKAKINKIYDPTDKEEHSRQFVYDRYYTMKDSPQRKEAEDSWTKAEEQWDAMPENEGEDWQADYYVPLTTSYIESILSEMVDQSPRPIILPLSSSDKPKATVMKHIFNYTWETADGDMELYNVLKDTLIYGNGFAQEYFWQDRRMIKQLIEVSQKNKRKENTYKEVEALDFDDCYMESVSPWDLFWDEKAREINRGPNKARDCIRRYVMDIDSFRQIFKGKVWDPFGNAELVKPGGDTNYYSYFKPPEGFDKKDEVEVLWYWGRRPEDSLTIVANDVVVKDGSIPYKHKQLPFAKADDVRRPHTFIHYGEPRLLQSIQKEYNVLRRMLTDRNHLDIDKMWLIGRNETLTEGDTIARPHGVIRVDDPANYKPVEYNDVPKSYQLGIDYLQQDAVRVTGVDERYLSQAKSAGTATEAAILKESTLRRIRMKLRLVEKGFLVDIGRLRVSNIIQFYSQPKMEEIVGEKESTEYQQKISLADSTGRLEMIGNTPYEKKFREIPIENKEMFYDIKGQIKERPYNGISFFEATPDSFMPLARGGFNIRFEAGSTMPISKPLMQSKVLEMAQLLMPLATAGIGYDPVKLGDAVLEANDYDPQDYHKEDEVVAQEGQRDEMSINLAAMENEQIGNGKNIPPLGTPYAATPHSKVHLAFLKSEVGRSMPEPLYQKLVKHIMGEISAQALRGESDLGGQPIASPSGSVSPLPGGAQPTPPQGGVNKTLQDILPSKIQGGEQIGPTQGTMMGSQQSGVLSFLKNKFGKLRRGNV